MNRYNAAMLCSDMRNPYGRVTLPPQEQIEFLCAGKHYWIAWGLWTGLLTCKESARLADDAELDEDLVCIVLRPEFSAHLMEVAG